MPRFYTDDLDIDVDEFVNECDTSEIEDLIECLIEGKYIKPGSAIKNSEESMSSNNRMSANEEFFEEALNKLHGKYASLTSTEEEIIKTIASRF